MNKQTIIFLVVLAIIIGFFALVLMSDNKPVNVPTNPVTYSTTAPRVIPTEVVDKLPAAYSRDYMSSCNADGTLRNYCQCTLDYMFDALGTKELVRMSTQYSKTNVMPEIMVKAVTNCVDRL